MTKLDDATLDEIERDPYYVSVGRIEALVAEVKRLRKVEAAARTLREQLGMVVHNHEGECEACALDDALDGKEPT
jgi:hypothetical protein